MSSAAPVVSVCCITYNHAPFIRSALDGFLAQRTSFPIEVLVHDDASTDGTADIVRDYAQRHPGLIKPILQTDNQYSQGRRPSHFNYERARGEFIALCEGDDYWCDPQKLEKQVAAMRGSGAALSFHPAERVGADGMRKGEARLLGRFFSGLAVRDADQLIGRMGAVAPLASCVLTREALGKVLGFRARHPDLKVGDVVLQTLAILHGGAVYLDEVMSVYRHRVPGSWTLRHHRDSAFRIRYARDRIRASIALDEDSDGRFHDVFMRGGRRWLLRTARSPICTRRQKADLYREFGELLTPWEKVQYWAGVLTKSSRA